MPVTRDHLRYSSVPPKSSFRNYTWRSVVSLFNSPVSVLYPLCTAMRRHVTQPTCSSLVRLSLERHKCVLEFLKLWLHSSFHDAVPLSLRVKSVIGLSSLETPFINRLKNYITSKNPRNSIMDPGLGQSLTCRQFYPGLLLSAYSKPGDLGSRPPAGKFFIALKICKEDAL